MDIVELTRGTSPSSSLRDELASACLPFPFGAARPLPFMLLGPGQIGLSSSDDIAA